MVSIEALFSCLALSIAETRPVNKQLVRLGFEVVTLPFSEMIKSRGSVWRDMLSVERAGFPEVGSYEVTSVSLLPGGGKCQ